MEMTDERENLPSASGMERIALCPGSWSLEQQCPVPPEGEDAASGTRIHEFLAGNNVELSEDESLTARLCAEVAEPLLAGASSIVRETRLWCSDGYKKRFSGKPDVIAFGDREATVIDYKTGRGEVADSPHNLQLRALAVLVKHNWPDLEKVRVAIVQPWASRRPIVTEYDADALDEADHQIGNIVADAMADNAPLRPGVQQCQYCRAKTICPALARALDVAPGITLKKEGVAAAAGEMAAEQLGALVANRVPLARMLCDALEHEAFERLVRDPESVPGLTLDIGTPRVSDAKEIWVRAWLEANGMLTPSGRAKPGALAKAIAERDAAFSVLTTEKHIPRSSWTDTAAAASALQAAMTPEQYRRVSGRISANETPA